MDKLHTRFRTLLCSGAVLVLGCGGAQAADPGGPTHHTVYQQRLPDGTLLLTDRIPYGGEDNILEQSWTFPAEDPVVAAARRAELRAAHDAVNARINRLVVERERNATALQIERLRLAGMRAWADDGRDGGPRRAVVVHRR